MTDADGGYMQNGKGYRLKTDEVGRVSLADRLPMMLATALAVCLAFGAQADAQAATVGLRGGAKAGVRVDIETTALATSALDCSADVQPTLGSYVVHNNQWGRDGVTGPFRQCVGIALAASVAPAAAGIASAGTGVADVAARWTWQWPPGPNEIKGFPGIGYGAKPGHRAPLSALPLRVDALRHAVTRWSTRSQVSGRGQLAYDLWLTKDGKAYPTFDATPITHEIMIALEPYGGYGLDRNPAWYRGELQIGRDHWRLYSVDGFGSVGWRFIVLQPPAARTAGELDLRDVLLKLRERQLITGQEYLTSIELGSEPMEGAGDVILERFSVEVR